MRCGASSSATRSCARRFRAARGCTCPCRSCTSRRLRTSTRWISPLCRRSSRTRASRSSSRRRAVVSGTTSRGRSCTRNSRPWGLIGTCSCSPWPRRARMPGPCRRRRPSSRLSTPASRWRTILSSTPISPSGSTSSSRRMTTTRRPAGVSGPRRSRARHRPSPSSVRRRPPTPRRSRSHWETPS